MKVCIIDIDWTTAFPENALYLGARILEYIPEQDLTIVKFATSDDIPHVREAVGQCLNHEALLFFNFDYFNCFDFQIDVLQDIQEAVTRLPDIYTIACGILPTAAESFFIESGIFDAVIAAS